MMTLPSFVKIPSLWLVLTLAVSASPGQDICNRPQYHFTAPSGWINDPVGLVFQQGEYHLFFQYTPQRQRVMVNTHWGHAVSCDLVHWEVLAPAIHPEDGCPAFSGSAVVDVHNTAGFQEGVERPLVAIYTGWGRGQCVAYSNDRGRNWTPYSGNPVLTLPGDALRSWAKTARDPKVFWYEPEKKWVMLLYQNLDGEKGHGFYTSLDLIQWEFQSHLAGFYVCPDLFQLSVDDNADHKKWVLLDWEKYVVGSFDGSRFVPESAPAPLDYGANFSANQTWNDIPASDGRRIQIAWLRGGAYPGMPFSQQLTFPCRLSLRKSGPTYALCRTPIEEIRLLYDGIHITRDVVSTPDKDHLAGIPGRLFDLEMELLTRETQTVAIRIGKQAIQYDPRLEQLHCSDQQGRLRSENDCVTIRLLIDRASLEVFGNEGEMCMSFCMPCQPDDLKLHIYGVDGGNVTVRSLKIRRLRSMYEHRPVEVVGFTEGKSAVHAGDVLYVACKNRTKRPLD